MKYVYCVLLGYQYAKRLVPEATRNAMLHQHKLLKTKNFREISIKANYLESCRALCFGDVKTALDVKAYYNVGNSTYDKIAAGSSVYQNAAVRTSGNNDSAASGGSSRSTTAANSGNKVSDTSFVLNTSSNIFHRTGCSHVNEMSASNKQILYNTSFSEMVAKNYDPCDDCLPK